MKDKERAFQVVLQAAWRIGNCLYMRRAGAFASIVRSHIKGQVANDIGIDYA